MKYLKEIIIFVVGFMLGAVVVGVWLEMGSVRGVSSFEGCVRQGNAVMESYPRQCIDKSGKHWVEAVEMPVPGEPEELPRGGSGMMPLPIEEGPIPVEPDGGMRGVACTMEAKECPDGSFVGRQGPNCEFAECPGN